MEKSVKLTYKNETFEFPLVGGTENELGIDIKTLRSLTGLVTLDPGFKNSGSCKSAVTFLDGEKGILKYRGYDIEDLANGANFLEVAYLLIFGELPTASQLDKFQADINEEAIVDEDLKMILKSFPKTAHPMGILASLTSSIQSKFVKLVIICHDYCRARALPHKLQRMVQPEHLKDQGTTVQ